MAARNGGGFLRKLGIDRPDARAWALYDWANSAVYTSIVGALFPVFFVNVVASGLSDKDATRAFSWATTLAITAVALTAPLLGAFADIRACKKKFLAVFAGLGILSCAGLFFVDSGAVTGGLVLFGLTNVGAAGSLVFYDALLPHVARPGQIDQLSGTGFGLGYLGGGLLLALHVAWIQFPERFGLPGGDSTLPVRLAFLSVAVWWAVFSIPLFRHVPEPRLPVSQVSHKPALGEAFRRLGQTLRELRRYRQAFLMLLAILIYNDGIATVIRMAAIYSQIKGFAPEVALKTFLLVQFVGFPAAILFGRFAERFGPKAMIIGGLTVYVGVCLFALSMSRESHFFLLGLAIGCVQGGCQALGRSLFARFVPRHRSGEFFALLAVGEKFAGILGPLFFAVAVELLEEPEPAILALIPFFVVGAWLVSRVDVQEGIRTARAVERAYAVEAQSAAEGSSLPSDSDSTR